MIVRDPILGIIGQHDPNDPNYLDFGDSSRSSGMMATFGSRIDQSVILYHCTPEGFVRHPKQEPWNNPKNFSRDQLLCLVAGLRASGFSDLVKTEFKRQYWTGFCPNGDFLGPEFYWHMILCGRIWWMYWFAPIGFIAQLFHILWATKINPEHEQNQTIAIAKVSGLLWLWAWLHLDWKYSVRKYWGLMQSAWRYQPEAAAFIITGIEREI